MELEVYKIDGTKTARTVTLNDSVFGIEPNDHSIYLDVKQYLANKRQGTHAALEKSQMAASTKKLKKQKGTGGARAGSIKSPLFKGGARVFGPRPRDYSFKLNKKVKQLARASALSYKAKEDKIFVIENLDFEAPRTKDAINFLNNFNLLNKKALIVLSESNKNVYLSTRNLQKAKTITALNINTYEIMNASTLMISESSISELERISSNE